MPRFYTRNLVIHSTKHLLRACCTPAIYYILDSVVDVWVISVNKKENSSCPHGAWVLVEGDRGETNTQLTQVCKVVVNAKKTKWWEAAVRWGGCFRRAGQADEGLTGSTQVVPYVSGRPWRLSLWGSDDLESEDKVLSWGIRYGYAGGCLLGCLRLSLTEHRLSISSTPALS